MERVKLRPVGVIFSGRAGDDRFQPMRVTVSKAFAVAWALTLAMLITSLATVREAEKTEMGS
jgi:hypothetical protein